MPSKPLFGMPVVVGMSAAVMAMRSVPCAFAIAEIPKNKPEATAAAKKRRDMANPPLRGRHRYANAVPCASHSAHACGPGAVHQDRARGEADVRRDDFPPLRRAHPGLHLPPRAAVAQAAEFAARGGEVV